MKKIAILLLSLLALCGQNYAQNWSERPLTIAFMDESIALPSHQLFAEAFNPGIIIGTEILLKDRENADWLISPELGYFYHKDLENAVFLRANALYRYRTSIGLNIEGTGGLGYMHTFFPSERYAFNDQGDLEQVREVGRPHAIISLGLGLSYDFPTNTDPSFGIFTRYETVIETPFANGIPLIPHTLFQVGVRFYPFK